METSSTYLLNSLLLASFILLTGCFPNNEKAVIDFEYQPKLKPFNNCDELTTYLQDTLNQERKLIDYYEREVMFFGVPEQAGSSAEDTATNSDSVSAPSTQFSSEIADYTSTNNQVEGVDEADFIKVGEQGKYTYLVTGGYFIIIDNWPAEQMKELVRVELTGTPADLFVYQNMVWIVSNIYNYDYVSTDSDSLVSFAPRVNQLTNISIYDISDRNAPELLRQTTVEGYYLAARRIKNMVHMVSSAQINLYPLYDTENNIPDINDLLPMLTDNLGGTGNVEPSTELISECGSIFRPETANGTGTLSVISFDLNQPVADIKRQTIISNSGTVYANQDHLYIATMENNYWTWLPVVEGDIAPKPGTTFHKFKLAEQPVYQASGRVDGFLINQFAMDEYNDLLRTVTTVDEWWSNRETVNSLYILEQSGNQLVQRSQLSGLGKQGERIYAARFIGDKGFLVTFRQIDPLYTLDLSDPDNPLVAGELEVPGFSTYLHPVDEGLLLAIGRDVDSNSIKLSLFDVNDFANPELLHDELTGSGSYSEAEYNHKAFTWFAQEKLLAIPVSRWNYDLSISDSVINDVFNGLKLYKVDETSGFEVMGEIDHSNFYRDETDQHWYYPENIQRSFFMTDTEQNNFIYSISNRGLKVNSIPGLLDLAEVELPEYQSNNVYYAF